MEKNIYTYNLIIEYIEINSANLFQTYIIDKLHIWKKRLPNYALLNL